MRRFRDASGGEWDVLVGKASWGTLSALFVPIAPGAQIREIVLPVRTQLEAETKLEEMDDVALIALLAGAPIKEQG